MTPELRIILRQELSWRGVVVCLDVAVSLLSGLDFSGSVERV